MHDPIYLENTAKNSIFVFIHGFMGSPRQFDRLAHSVHAQGYSAASLLLPGHGSTVKEFSSATMENWQDYIEAEVGRLPTDYDGIHLVGHSMGCLLAINEAAKNRRNIHSLFLIACPLKLKGFSVHSLKVRLKQVFYRKSHPVKAVYMASNSVPPTPSLIWRIAKPTAELKKLIQRTNNNLSSVHVPVTAVFSLDDELVSIESLDMLKNGLAQASFNSIMISDSLHAYYPEHEYSIIESSLFSSISIQEQVDEAL